MLRSLADTPVSPDHVPFATRTARENQQPETIIVVSSDVAFRPCGQRASPWRPAIQLRCEAFSFQAFALPSGSKDS